MTPRHDRVPLEPDPKVPLIDHSSAKDRFRIRQRPVALAGANGSKCPKAVIQHGAAECLSWMEAVEKRAIGGRRRAGRSAR